MNRVGHLFDGSADWQQRVTVSHILDRLPRDRYGSFVATIAGDATQELLGLGAPVEVLPAPCGLSLLAAPSISRFAARKRIHLMHAWGVPAATAAGALHGIPLIVHLFDPLTAHRHAKYLRTLTRPSGFAIACSCETVRRRLVEGGVPMEVTVVIRPGVDFALINRIQRSNLREQLGVTARARLIIFSEPVSRAGGQFEAVLAAAVGSQLTGDTRVVLPGQTRERRRIERFVDALLAKDTTIVPAGRIPYEHLVAVADVLLITPRGDTSTTSIAWAMAAGTAVVGTAVYSVAELIAHRVNGLLYKQVRGQSMAASINGLLKDSAAQEKTVEVARGQAYDVFGLRRFIDQIARLYDNVLGGQPPQEGIVDSSIEQ